MAYAQAVAQSTESDTLADILERVLNTGVVIVGDIKIKLCDVELLSIQLRLLICSVEKAQELGIPWWWQQSAPAAAPRLPSRSGASLSAPRLDAGPTWEEYQRFREFERFRETTRADRASGSVASHGSGATAEGTLE